MWDIDFQYRWSPAEYHHFIAGANYRANQDFERGGFSFELIPHDFLTQWASVFAQDEMTLVDDYMYFTLGCRLEYNTFGKFQPEPTARLLIQPTDRQSIWWAVSRAVRNPTRFDTGIQLRTQRPATGIVFPVRRQSGVSARDGRVAYEIGYRAPPVDSFSWDICRLHERLSGTAGFGAPGPLTPIGRGLFVVPVELENNVSALTGGAELTATWQLRKDWQLFGSYSLFEINASGPCPIPVLHRPIQRQHGAQQRLYLRSQLGSLGQLAVRHDRPLHGQRGDRGRFSCPNTSKWTCGWRGARTTTWKSAWSVRTCCRDTTWNTGLRVGPVRNRSPPRRVRQITWTH